MCGARLLVNPKLMAVQPIVILGTEASINLCSVMTKPTPLLATGRGNCRSDRTVLSSGTIGTLGLNPIVGPSYSELDVNLIKRVRIAETKEFQIRVDAINVLNHPNFSDPTTGNLNINSTGFGSITSTRGTLTSATGSRMFLTSLRLNF